MIQITQKENCCGCHACRAACPSNCIDMMEDSEGFLYPQANKNDCTECGICENVCPMLCTLQHGKPPMAFAAWHRDELIRMDSSSGGVFSALMRNMLNQGGIVFGAAFDETMILRHQSAQNEDESHKFRGSKYLQSVIGDVYIETGEHLKQGRRVLFSGTPCQIAGLYSFLGKNDINLFTCDIVCHGVPSPKVFSAYKANLERIYGAKVNKISFRRKDYGWKKFSVGFSFENAKEYLRVLTEDPFMVGFLKNTYLRPSCHVCPFSRLPRMADISLADYWGVGDHHPAWDDDGGVSLVLVQTKKGQDTFDAIRGELVVHNSDLDVAIKSNPCICGSVPPRQNRAAFFSDLDRLSFEKVIKKYMSHPSIWHKAINLTRRLVKYVLRYL